MLVAALFVAGLAGCGGAGHRRTASTTSPQSSTSAAPQTVGSTSTSLTITSPSTTGGSTAPATTTPTPTGPQVTASPATSAVPPAGGAGLPIGMYLDGPLDQPHYVITVTNGTDGQVSFVYQNGRTAPVATFTASVSGGTVSARFSNGQTLSGAVAADRFTLTGCSTVLQFATQPTSCTFTRQFA